jgi:hypothetical protein
LERVFKVTEIIEVKHDATYAVSRRGLCSHDAFNARDSPLDGANDCSLDVHRQGTGISDSDADRRAPHARVDAGIEPNECARSQRDGRDQSRERYGWTLQNQMEEAHGIPGVGQRSDLHQLCWAAG